MTLEQRVDNVEGTTGALLQAAFSQQQRESAAMQRLVIHIAKRNGWLLDDGNIIPPEAP